MAQLNEKQIVWEKLSPQKQIDFLFEENLKQERLIKLLILELQQKGTELSFELIESLNNFYR